MNRNDNLPKLIRFLEIRSQASEILDGPSKIRFEMNGEDFSGGPTLSLATRNPFEDIIESRSVYADLFSELQSVAVLRTVYWHGNRVKQTLREGRDYTMILPARFVIFPIEHLKSWLSEFQGLSLPLYNGLDEPGKWKEIRQLRIELNYIGWVVERGWEVGVPGHAKLNKQWAMVWKYMSDALNNQPILETFTEGFTSVEGQVLYDLEMYSTDLKG